MTTPPPPLPHIPHDIIFFNILNRLPVKSLLRFRSVSKLWQSTIEEPEFKSSHLIHAKENPRILSLFHVQQKNDEDNNHYRVMSFHPSKLRRNLVVLHPSKLIRNLKRDTFEDYFSLQHTKQTFIIGSCNGLYCIRSKSTFEIWNLSTQEILSLPLPKPPRIPWPHLSLRILNCGFGFDPMNNEYKVVLIFHGTRCMVYTLWTNSWRDITLSTNLSTCLSYYSFPVLLSDRAVYANTALNWFVGPTDVISFNINKENFGLIRGPSLISSLPRPALFEWRGSLAVAYHKPVRGVVLYRFSCHNPHSHISCHNPHRHTHLDCWVETEVRFPCLLPKSPLSVMSILGQDIFYWFNEGGVIIYNSLSTHMREVKAPLGTRSFLCESDLFCHIESLLCLKTLVPPGATQIRYMKAQNVKQGGEQSNKIIHQSAGGSHLKRKAAENRNEKKRVKEEALHES